ncbi:hypothetical protein D3C87_94040 [compost metagenome]
MRLSFLFSLLFCFIAFNSLAECAGNGLYAFPGKGEIKKTSLFVLDGYAESQHIIEGLNSKYAVYLKSEDERIPLKVLEIHTGQFNLTQALLKPEKELIPGKKYQLIIDNLPDYERWGEYNSKTRKYDPVTYFVLDESDHEAPQWIKTPKENDKSLVHLGCGPSIHVNFEMSLKENSDYLVKTIVKSIESGRETTYYISASKEQITIGHGMCSGAFAFSEGDSFEVKFQVMDASGNTSSETEWIAFTKPTD